MQGTPFGRYRLVELLGHGGMGEVWRAHDTETDRIVAIKVLPAHLYEDEEFQRRFRREAHAAARLNSPHVIPIHNYGEIDGRLYVDMRLIEGRDLQAVLAEGPLELARAVHIIEQVAMALHAAHEVGLLHRDIKPSNILIDRNDFAYLIDFGIARAADETRMTKSGFMIGTFQYIAPERLGTGAEDARADIYSLACVLYECLTGNPPFDADSMARLVAAHLSTPPPRPSINRPDVPPRIDEVIATGMAKDPDQRYATTIELARAARGAITEPIARPTPGPAFLAATKEAGNRPTAEPGLAATRQSWPPPGQPWPADQLRPEPVSIPWRRHRRPGLIVAIVAAVGILAAGVGLTGYLLWRPATNSRPSAATTTTRTVAAPTTTTPTTATPVAESALQGLLLYPEQLDTVMGTTGMTLVGPKYPTSTFDNTKYVPDKACIPQSDPATATALSGSSWTAVSGQELNDQPGGKPNHRVTQYVILFPSARDADAFFTASTQQWPTCSNRQFHLTGEGVPDNVWTVGPVSNTDGALSAHKTLEPGYWEWQTCQRALTVANNVAIDVKACSQNQSDSQSDAGVNIARQIAAKVPTT
ncbi:protein kinase domain-containing protein [Mycobacterium sp.]|uniref:serine/threonine-protein kinase PknH/PknJ n=1 Tax=Mycobacterium sp. TaxID=1785 RepID=UPI003C70E8B2